jgi:hypothetical protein
MAAMLRYMPELTIIDRCDRCIAWAKVRAVFRNQSELLLCGHHFREHENRLVEVAHVVQFGASR